jgi:arsenate reductase-like glutaredoxin family protein
MFNFRSPSFKQLGLEPDNLNDSELIDLMLKEPRLIRRPVVRIDGKIYFSANRSALEGLMC